MKPPSRERSEVESAKRINHSRKDLAGVLLQRVIPELDDQGSLYPNLREHLPLATVGRYARERICCRLTGDEGEGPSVAQTPSRECTGTRTSY